jgi:hypothetical protein
MSWNILDVRLHFGTWYTKSDIKILEKLREIVAFRSTYLYYIIFKMQLIICKTLILPNSPSFFWSIANIPQDSPNKLQFYSCLQMLQLFFVKKSLVPATCPPMAWGQDALPCCEVLL